MDIQKIYNKNLTYIKAYDYDLYNNILNTNLNNYHLFLNDFGLNIKINEHSLYPKNSSNFIETQVINFLKNPSSYTKKPFSLKNSQYKDIHHKFYNTIKKASSYDDCNNNFISYYNNLDNYFPSLILYGIGTGQYIENLLSKVDIDKLFIIDEDYALLKVSMYIIDWVQIFNYFSSKNKSIKFYIDKDSEYINKAILNYYYHNTPFLLDFIPYFVHYQTNFFINIHNTLLENIPQAYTGLGWYDDEMIGLKNTLENIQLKYPIYTNRPKDLNNTNVFIIGSGPSIDKDIQYIKKYQNNAIIFSCASAINILEQNKLISDFHFEMERFEELPDYRINSISKSYLKKINLISLNVVSKEMAQLFQSCYLLTRKNDTGSNIIPEHIQKLDYTNPTAVNMAINFALDLGFKNIYLFGTDMGFRDENNHHSKYTAYSKGDNTKQKVFESFRPEVLQNKYFEGNFHKEKVYQSTSVFLLCKLRVENCINFYKYHFKQKINIYNCSDGLSIEETLPLKSSKIALSTIDKEEDIKLIIQSFSYTNQFHTLCIEKFTIEKKFFLDNIDSISAILKNCNITKYSELNHIFISIFSLLQKNQNSFTLPLLRGSLTGFFSFIITHSLATKDRNKAFIFINYSINQLILFLEEIKKDFLNLKI